jgi:hypothetical protein
MVIEAAGGWIAGSLALLADSAHMLTDSASLAMSYAAVRAASRPATAEMSYGHHRWQVLAALTAWPFYCWRDGSQWKPCNGCTPGPLYPAGRLLAMASLFTDRNQYPMWHMVAEPLTEFTS